MFKKIFNRIEPRVFTPVYLPGETYSFFLNGQILTDPNFSSFVFRLIKGDGSLAYANVGELKRYFIYDFSFPGGVPDPYMIYSIFVFPQVPLGEYYFQIWDGLNNVELLRSNPVICETVFIKNTVFLKYRNTTDIYGYGYEKLPNFYNMVRLPISEADEQFEVDKQQYRNATDKVFRNVKSYLNRSAKFQCYNFDSPAQQAMSIVLEHSTIYIDNVLLTDKTGLNAEPNPGSSFTNGTFDVYFGDIPPDTDSLEQYGEEIYFCGDYKLNPGIVYQAQTF